MKKDKLDAHELQKLKDRVMDAFLATEQHRERLSKRATSYHNLMLHKHGYSNKTHTIDMATGKITKKRYEPVLGGGHVEVRGEDKVQAEIEQHF